MADYTTDKPTSPPKPDEIPFWSWILRFWRWVIAYLQNPAAVAITGGTLDAVTITNSAFNGGTVGAPGTATAIYTDNFTSTFNAAAAIEWLSAYTETPTPQAYTVTNGSTTTITAYNVSKGIFYRYIRLNSGAIAAATLNLPDIGTGAIQNNSIIHVYSTGVITTLTVATTGATTVSNYSSVDFAARLYAVFQYSSAAGTWYRIAG